LILTNELGFIFKKQLY